jgi:catechol 2,3-dioxygenase-like lactoylglutathione lyase family enzyme
MTAGSTKPDDGESERPVNPTAVGGQARRAANLQALGALARAVKQFARREETPTMQLRFARHTNGLDELVRFYRDGLGLPEIGRFDDHAGYDGVFLAVPGTDAHLEFTSGGLHGPPAPHPETLLVLYLGSSEAVAQTCERVGAEPIEPANPYWQQYGVTIVDPDGFRVVLVPRSWSDS